MQELLAQDCLGHAVVGLRYFELDRKGPGPEQEWAVPVKPDQM